ncbi:MAG: VCBS repeat-containing protein [Bacteroidaceae bacterium]|nr:VCBS repeat-containing protein [Bacteroidaceae bacterium]
MKRQILLAALLSFPFVMSHAQQGDTMTDPIIVGTISSSITYQDTRNTNNYTNQYNGRSTKDVFYQFTLTDPATVTMTHEGSSFADTYMHLLDASGTCIAYNDDYSGEGHCSDTHMAYIRMQLEAGTYYIVSEGYSKNGNITTNITTVIQSAYIGDFKFLPIIIGSHSSDFSYTETVNTHRYTNQYTGQTTHDVYHLFALNKTMSVTITHDGSTLQDTYMTLLDSNGNLIESNNDYDGPSHCQDTHQAFIQKQLSAGTYYVVSEGNTTDGIIKVNITGNTSSDYGYSTIPSTYSTDPSTSVGGMGGQFAVSPTGGATYSIPIEVPVGVGGLLPQLSIVYNSQAGNGLCGYGTNLSGISAITRGPKDVYHDGTAQGIKYTANDALYLDGNRLILAEGYTAGEEGALYNPESDPFTNVITHVDSDTPDNIRFEVQTSDGMTYWYSASQKYYNNGTTKILAWYLDRAIQPTGNYMEYYYDEEYDQDQSCLYMYPVMIAYGTNLNDPYSPLSNTIQFSYETRSDVLPIKFDGKKGVMDRRLKTITCKTNEEIYRTYTLNYDTASDGSAFKYSRLTSITEKNSQNESLPSTVFDWSYLPSVSYESSNLSISPHAYLLDGARMPFSDQSYISGDMNNDGLCDIIGFAQEGVNNGSGGLDWYTYLYVNYASMSSTDSVHYVSGQQFRLPSNYNINSLISEINSVSVYDIDGDGTNELVMPFFISTGSVHGYIYIYVLGQNSPEEPLPIRRQLMGNKKPLFCSGDVDNDGKSETIILESTKTNGKYPIVFYKYNPNYIPGSTEEDHAIFELTNQYYSLSLPSKPKRAYLTDMNNDGLNDLMVICEDHYTIFWNQGGTQISSIFSDSHKLTRSDFNYWLMTAPGDFNGDGQLDFLTTAIDSIYWQFFIGNGDGTFNRIDACTLELYFQGFTNKDADKFHCDVFDFDGDGKDDVVITKAMWQKINYGQGYSITFDKTHTYWMRSTGTSLEQIYHATSTKDSDAEISKYITGDFDGDGRIELVNYGYDCVSGTDSNSDPQWRIYKNSNLTPQSGKVTSITGDYGSTTNITYATLTDNTVYTRGMQESYPTPRYTIPLNVVKETVQDNGTAGSLTTRYSYGGLKAHLKGKGLLGFTSTGVHNVTLGINTQTEILNWDNTFYVPTSTKTTTTIDGRTSQSISTLAIVDKGQKRYFAHPSQTEETDLDGNSLTTTYQYDISKGYITSQQVVYAPGMYRLTEYQNYTTDKVGGAYRPQRIVSSQYHTDDNSPFSQITDYTYDSRGFVIQTIENAQDQTMHLTTDRTYDLWGNLTSEVSTGSGIQDSLTTHYQYESTHRFPVRTYTTPSSSVQKNTYDIWGNILTERDSINQSIDHVITHTYDAWGNRTHTQIPGTGEITYRSGWGSDNSKRFYTLRQGTASPWVKTWYDSRGREVMTESIGPKNITISTSITYNSKGTKQVETQTTGDLTLTHTYQYDARGRITRETHPGSNITTYTYTYASGSRSTTVNDNGRRTTYTYDAMGNLKTVQSPQSSTLTNWYSSNGNIRKTVANGATWTFQFDNRGNRISMTDPDAGTSTYSYDALGRVTQHVDGRGVVFVTNYDYLGRVTTKSATQSGWTETITRTYGTSGTGQMRLISESLGNWTKNYEYDTYGKVTNETMTNGTDITRNKAYQYNSSNGLLLQKTLPGGVTNSYTYDAYGNLTGVNGASGAIKWSLSDYTGRSTETRTVLDNCTSSPFTRITHLDQYGYPEYIKTHQNGYYYQTDEYGFSVQTGNLMAKKQKGMNHYMLFHYDDNDRLSWIEENGQNIMSMSYTPNGNITEKSDIGSYTYNSTSKPHAVQSVQNSNDKINYNEQNIVYNPWNKVDNIWQTDDTDFYYYFAQYGPDLQKVYSTMDKTYHREYDKFFWDDYEEKIENGVTTRYYYVSGADGLVGLHTEKDVPSGTVTNSYAIITDHLGSITMMVDNYDDYNEIRYDVWGNRTVQESFLDEVIDRGYTGHEHLDQLGLIDMKGRMYDPRLGRFLSPDPFVQAPTDPQNYNRYSYCLNNPLKYTDPSGDFFTWSLDDGVISLGVNFWLPLGLPLGFGINIGYGDGFSLGVYGEIGLRVGGTGFGSGVCLQKSYDYNYKKSSWSNTTSVNVYASCFLFSVGVNSSITCGKYKAWSISAGLGYGNDEIGCGFNFSYGSNGWNWSFGGYGYSYSNAWESNPDYDSDFWNNNKEILENNNCYSYMLDEPYRGNENLTPGSASGLKLSYPLTVDDVVNAVIADGQGRVKKTNFFNKLGFGKKGYYSGYLVVGDNDCHFYRQDKGGTWSSKHGKGIKGKVNQNDGSGPRSVIIDPRFATHNYGPTHNYDKGGVLLWIKR